MTDYGSGVNIPIVPSPAVVTPLAAACVVAAGRRRRR
jgi:hypothetical protein